MEEKFITQNKHVQLVISIDDLRQVFNEFQDERDLELAKNCSENTYLSSEEVCQYLHISKTTLWRWKKENYLHPVKIGSSFRYLKSDVEKLR